jgi:hypothetical protein
MSPEELAKQRYTQISKNIVSKLLALHSDKNFVKRILNAKDYPDMPTPEGYGPKGHTSTHLMATAEVDGKSIMFPMISYDEKKKSLYMPKDPVREALDKGDFIEFSKPEEAEWFSKNYKLGMPDKD